MTEKKIAIVHDGESNLANFIFQEIHFSFLLTLYQQARCVEERSNVMTWDEISETLLPNSECHGRIVLSIKREVSIDERLFHLGQRYLEYKDLGFSTYTISRTSEIIIRNSLTIINQFKINKVISTHIPHNLVSWLFCRVAEIIGIPVIFFMHSPIPNRRWWVLGLDRRLPIFPLYQREEAVNDDEIKSLIDVYRTSYDKAVPYYSEDYRRKTPIELKNALTYILSSGFKNIPGHALRLIRGLNLYHSYNKISIQETPVSNYAIFFLSLQPEATSLPNGGEFCQQISAILQLRAGLPEGVTLLVRDHPDMYKRGGPRHSVRDIEFYKTISHIPNTFLVRMDLDPFELVDNALAVASLNGTICLQAASRGRLAFVFSCSHFEPLNRVKRVRNADDIRHFFESENLNKLPMKKDVVRNFYESVYRTSFPFSLDSAKGSPHAARSVAAIHAMKALQLSEWSYKPSRIFETSQSNAV